MNRTIFRTYAIYFTILALFVGIRISANLGAFSFMPTDIGNSYFSTIVIQIVLMFLVTLGLSCLMFKEKPKQVFKDFRFKKISFKAVLISFGIGILLFFLNLIVASFFSSILSGLGYSSGGSSSSYSYDTFWKFLGGVFFVAVLPGFCEEFLHRGLLMRKVGDNRNYKFAIMVSAVCFGLMHLNIEQFFYATILGIIIGFVGAVSDSIFPCMILHFCNNFVSVYLSYANTNNLFGGDFYKILSEMISNNQPLFTFMFILFVGFLIVAGLIFLIVQLFNETKAKDIQKALINVQKEVSGEDLENVPQEQIATDFKSYILPHIKNNEDILNLFLPAPVLGYKRNLADNIFLIASLFLGILITFFTFVWGVV